MYDQYGQIIVFKPLKANDEILNLALKRGFKKIYERSPFTGLTRVFKVKSVSPFLERPFNKKYLHKEGQNLFYGDLEQVYFSPRYFKERLFLFDFFKKYQTEHLTVIGAGISPFAVHLFKRFKSITEYELNLLAQRYSKINHFINNTSSTYINAPYDFKKENTVVLVIIPKSSLDFYKKILFSRCLVFYILLNEPEVEKFELQLTAFFKIKPLIKKAIKYSKSNSIYRVILEKSNF